MHRIVACGLGEHGEDPHGPGVVERQEPDARRAGEPPGDLREGAAEPAIAVIEDDQRLRRGSQADMLLNSGVTSASMAS